MGRVPDLPADEMSAEQLRLYEEIKGPRGNVGGPFALWIRVPQIAAVANAFGNALRLDGKLDRRLFELMVLVIARYWDAQYEWFVHEPAAIKAGLSADVAAAIRAGDKPVFRREDERVVATLTAELLETRTVSQETYDHVLAMFGLELFIEMITVAGFYVTAAMMINTFEAPVPGDAHPLPALPAR
jgi:4-carboxymuconolactone decarboxylase